MLPLSRASFRSRSRAPAAGLAARASCGELRLSGSRTSCLVWARRLAYLPWWWEATILWARNMRSA
uniref:Uncharacterized protein n=1 Tax=Arundo donax TaxID=35708 RepID=A0A0A9EDK2_ARUDO